MPYSFSFKIVGFVLLQSIVVFAAANETDLVPARPSSTLSNRDGTTAFQVIPPPTESVQPITFSDADEVAGSNSIITVTSGRPGVTIAYKIKQYGGLVLSNEKFNGAQLESLQIDISQVNGKPLPALLQFTSKNGARCFFPIEISSPGTTSERVIPFGHFSAFNSALLSQTVQLSLVLPAGEGVLRIRSLSLVSSKIASSFQLPPPPPKSKVTLSAGFGAWCYGSPDFITTQIETYNRTAVAGRKIRYLFPQVGNLTVTENGQMDLTWQIKQPTLIRKALDAQGLYDVQIFPMIDGLTDNLSKVSDVECKRIAKQIGDFVEKDSACAGVHFDLEPDNSYTYFIFAAVRSFTGKPITAAAAEGTPELFRYTDLAILMAYDLGYSPEKYKLVAASRIKQFLGDARKENGYAMIGIPAIATHHEMSASSVDLSGPKTQTGFQMADYVRDAMTATDQVQPGANPDMAGYCIWAIYEPYALHSSSDTRYYFPGHVSDDIWTLLGNEKKL